MSANDAKSDEGNRRERVLDAVGEAFNEFVFYGRKLDPSLTTVQLQDAVRDGVVSKQEIVDEFRRLIDTWDVMK